MFTHVGLLQFTDKGLHGIKDTTKRAAAAKEPARKVGVNMRELLWTQGEFDMVCIVEAEAADEAALAAFTLATALEGNVRFRTLRAHSAAEMDKILARLRWPVADAPPVGLLAGCSMQEDDQDDQDVREAHRDRLRHLAQGL
jgi:uncharacterized protein with GYD domain